MKYGIRFDSETGYLVSEAPPVNIILSGKPRILICGAAPRHRTGDPGWTNRNAIRSIIYLLPKTAIVIHGAAKGADVIAGEEAEAYLGSERVFAFPAQWRDYGSAAGPIRNKQMLEIGQPHAVVYFHSDLAYSKGTRDMVNRAVKAGLEVFNGISSEDISRFEQWMKLFGSK